jgi:hypothetical protein
MARAYYSTVLEQPAEQVWGVVRDFGNDFWWTSDPVETTVEEGKSGDTVGAIRHMCGAGLDFRQRLLALSDRDRFFTYEFCDPNARPVRNLEVTLRVTPIIDGNRAFIEWWATFDCEAAEHDHWTTFFIKSFAQWLGSLRAHLADK